MQIINWKNRTKISLIFSCFLISLNSCSFFHASPAPDSGFIPHPETMVPSFWRAPFDRAWFADKEKFKKMKLSYRKLYIRPVDVTHLSKAGSWGNFSSLGQANDPKDVSDMAEYMKTAFTKAIKNHPTQAIKIVDQPGPETFILELALVELNPTKVAVNATGTAVGFFVPGSGLISTTGKGSIAFEAIVKDGETEEVLVTFADRQEDKVTLMNYRSYLRYGFGRLIVNEWADQYAELSMTGLEHKVEGSSPFKLLPW